MIKKNGIRLTRRSKSINEGLACAITTYARVQMPPYGTGVGLTDIRYNGLHTGIKNARCGTIGQNSLSFVDMLKT